MSRVLYYKGVPSVRTTISCRLVAPTVLALGVVIPSVTRAPADDPALRVPSEVRWSATLAAPAAGGPVLAGTYIYFPLQSGVVVAHRLADGGEVWRKELRPDQPLSADAEHVFVAAGEAIYAFTHDGTAAWHVQSGALTAPLLTSDGWVIAASGGRVSAYRAADGTQVWQRDTGVARARASIEGNRVYVPAEDGRLLALELADGTPRWEHRFKGTLTEVLPFADRVYVGASDRYFYCLDAGDGSIAWRVLVGTALRGKPAGDAERAYVVALDNQLRAYDRRSGSLKWPLRAVPFRPSGGPTVLGSMILVAGLAPDVHAFNAVTGDPIGKISLPAPLLAPPAFLDTRLGVLMTAITGDLNAQWKLSLTGQPPAPIPSPKVAPLTALPGQPVPAGRGGL